MIRIRCFYTQPSAAKPSEEDTILIRAQTREVITKGSLIALLQFGYYPFLHGTTELPWLLTAGGTQDLNLLRRGFRLVQEPLGMVQKDGNEPPASTLRVGALQLSYFCIN